MLNEGDPADDLFVVRSGALVVRSSGGAGGVGRDVNTMGPGDWFGEIGVLRLRPRTATVTVTEPVDLVRVPGVRRRATLPERRASSWPHGR